MLVSWLRSVATADGPKSYAASIVRALQKLSPEFAEIWDAHEVGVAHSRTKRFRHPVVGELELYCEVIDNRGSAADPDGFHRGAGQRERASKLAVLAVRRSIRRLTVRRLN